MNKNRDESFLERLNSQPNLRERMEALLDVVENTAGDCTKADDAEQHVTDELKKMGSDVLHCWAEKAALKAVEELRKQKPGIQGNGKKTLLAHDIWKNRGHGTNISLSSQIIEAI